jgi:hypothetical protein
LDTPISNAVSGIAQRSSADVAAVSGPAENAFYGWRSPDARQERFTESRIIVLIPLREGTVRNHDNGAAVHHEKLRTKVSTRVDLEIARRPTLNRLFEADIVALSRASTMETPHASFLKDAP